MSKDLLIIFSRYPEAGRTKTRLIPALGAQGAAALQRELTEYTLQQVKELKTFHSMAIAIYFTGGNQSLMQQWLGNDLMYQPQCEGDLGKRMSAAFAEAFTSGKKRVVMIGIDCPELNPSLLRQAFEALHDHDLVLGSAKDGGYYLIGLRRWFPELFVGIPWGTSEVFPKTVSLAEKSGLAIAFLPQLRDIDHPEDLSIWEELRDKLR